MGGPTQWGRAAPATECDTFLWRVPRAQPQAGCVGAVGRRQAAVRDRAMPRAQRVCSLGHVGARFRGEVCGVHTMLLRAVARGSQQGTVAPGAG